VNAPRARVVKHGGETVVAPLLAPGPSAQQRRRIAREELEAKLAADAIVQEAHAQAEEILAQANEAAAQTTVEAREEARRDADRTLVARWLALREAEARRSATDADRVVPVAVALAERLVGAALELQPSRVAALAAGVLAETRGARRATIHAHPADAEALRTHLADGGLDPSSVEIRDDTTLARGALRLHTDVGIIDAQLAPRLERLAEALRDALR
jgi:type III secretion protein L